MRHHIQRPRFSPTMRPASASALVWWLTVGCDLPSGSCRSHEQHSPAEAMRLSRRSRTGSASAAKALASSAASASARGAANTTPQQPTVAPAGTAVGVSVGIAASIVTTGAHIDNGRYIRECQSIDSPQSNRRPGMSRVQLALNVSDIDSAVDFYSRLFGTEPAKRRPGYANFAVAEP